MSERVNWPGLMRAGLHGLGLRPGEFWALTPVELETMLGKGAGILPLKRARFDELMTDFPDLSGDQDND